MLTLTQEAQEAVSAISRPSAASQLPGLRIACRRDRATFAVRRVVTPEESDLVVEHDGARVLLGPLAALKLSNSVLDVRTDDRGRLQFVVRDAA